MTSRPPTNRVLLLHKGGIGDVVFGLPLISSLRAAYPDAELTVLTHDAGKQVLDFCPLIDRVTSFGPMTKPWSLKAARSALGPGSYELALSTTRSLRAAYLLWALGAKTRVGFKGGPEQLLYTHRAPVRPFEVVFEKRFLRLATAVGCSAEPPPGRLVVRAEERERAKSQLRSSGWDGRALIALHVGGGWQTKQPPIEHVIELVRSLTREHGVGVLLQGGPSDRERASRAKAVAPEAVVDDVGASIADAIAHSSLCVGAIGVDSGLSHAAAALGIPTVLLFGPSDPRSVVTPSVFVELPCRPCNRAGKNGCPLGHHRCMKDLVPPRIIAALNAARSAA